MYLKKIGSSQKQTLILIIKTLSYKITQTNNSFVLKLLLFPSLNEIKMIKLYNHQDPFGKQA